MNDERFYDEVAQELQAKTMILGLWTKAFADANGNVDRARAVYIKYRVAQLNKSDEQKYTLISARFATLLVSLSEQADETTRENLKMQSKLTRLTWGLFWLTLMLTLVAAVQFFMALK